MFTTECMNSELQWANGCVRFEVLRVVTTKINVSGMWHHLVWYKFTGVVNLLRESLNSDYTSGN